MRQRVSEILEVCKPVSAAVEIVAESRGQSHSEEWVVGAEANAGGRQRLAVRQPDFTFVHPNPSDVLAATEPGVCSGGQAIAGHSSNLQSFRLTCNMQCLNVLQMFTSDLTPASADPTDPDDGADEADRMAGAVERAELRLARVQEITAIGMTLLRGLGERVASAPTAAEVADAAADAADDFAKVSRALRLTLDLEARLDETLRALQAGEDVALKARRERRARRDADAEKARHQARREKVTAQVSIAIARESEGEAGDEDRYEAMEERLLDDPAYDDLTDRPLREVVGQLCADIGLTVDWTGWTENGWPEPPRSGHGARDRWSPFRTPKPKADRPPGLDVQSAKSLFLIVNQPLSGLAGWR